jgi:hypothetical protein
VLPCRELPYSPWARAIWLGLPAAILALGGASVAARRGLWRGGAIVAVGLGPTLPLLPIGPDFETIRWIYYPMVGISLAVASVLSGASRRAALRWGSIVGVCVLEIAAGIRNYPPWEEAGADMRAAIALSGPVLASAPKDARGWLPGLPWVVRGAYCANCGIPFLYQRISGRQDIQVFDPVGAVGPLDFAAVLDPKNDSAADLLDPTGAVTLEPGRAWSFDFFTGDMAAAGVRAIDLRTWLSRRMRVFRSGLPGVLLLPVMKTTPGARMVVSIVGDLPATPVNPFDHWLRRTVRAPAGLSRRPIPLDEPQELPAGVDTFRIDVTIPHLNQATLRSIEVKILP